MSGKENPSSEGAGSAEKNIAEVASPATTEASTPVEGAGIEQVQDETMEDVMGANENFLAQLLNTSAAMDIDGGGEGAADSTPRSNEQGRTSRRERRRRREEEEREERKRKREEEEREERKRRRKESDEDQERKKPIPPQKEGTTSK